MTGMDFSRAARLATAIVATIALSAATAATAIASKTTIYDNIPGPLPGNVVSQGFECCQTSEFGGQVQFAPGNWKNPNVTVLMSSWACQEGTWYNENCVTEKGAKFEWPITISIYRVGPNDEPGPKIAAASKVFKIRYRPSTSPICNSVAGYEGGWYDKKEESCNHGIASKIKIGLKVAELPERAIVSVSYNTSDYGAQPQRPKPCDSEEAGCPYDSLNVGAEDALSVGSYPLPDYAYIDSTAAGEYCGSGTPVGTFGVSGSVGNPCWSEYQPSIEVAAKEIS